VDKKVLKRKKGGHAPGTCSWILRTKELTAWLSSGRTVDPERQAAQVLWLYGNPGTGKSIMAIYLAEELPEASINTDGGALAYFFCDSGFDTRKTATSIVRGLLYQLVGRHQQLLDYLLPKYHERGTQLFTSFDALWEIFMAMVADQNTGRKYCIIDALDECDRESQKTLSQQLEETFQSGNVSPNVRILITSRPYTEIRESLQSFPNKDLASFPERQEDIDICIKEKLNQLARSKNYTEKVKVQVHDILRDKAEGTFLWIGLACDELQDITSNRVIRTLQNIPKGLNSLYKRLLETALEQNETSGDDIRRLLSYMAVSSRPMTVSELCEACQLYQEEEDFETRIQFTHDDIDSCRLLIIIQDEKVSLLHQSVKDFLIGASSGYFIEVSETHALLAYRCVDLLIERFRSTNQPHTSFSDYATLEWANHARMAKSNFKVQHSQAQFFQLDSPCRERWLQDLRSTKLFYESIPDNFSIFHIAAQWGVSYLVDYASDWEVQASHIEKSTHVVHVDCVDSYGRTPLERAAQSTYTNVVAALLGRGGKVTGKVLSTAASHGRNGKEIMALLLDCCGDQITITKEVVEAAAGNWGNGKEVIALLLDRYGDQITITNEVVKAAVKNEKSGKEVMALLLDRRADQINITNEVVKAAVGNRRNGKELIALLLDRCADQITITNEVVKAAAGNEESGKEVIALLLDRCGDQITVTNEVVVAAGNGSSGFHREIVGSDAKPITLLRQ
jgi:hypothetical protein